MMATVLLATGAPPLVKLRLDGVAILLELPVSVGKLLRVK